MYTKIEVKKEEIILLLLLIINYVVFLLLQFNNYNMNNVGYLYSFSLCVTRSLFQCVYIYGMYVELMRGCGVCDNQILFALLSFFCEFLKQ